MFKNRKKLQDYVITHIFFQTKGDKTAGFSHLEEQSARHIAKMAVGLLPALCDHLQGASAFFQVNVEKFFFLF